MPQYTQAISPSNIISSVPSFPRQPWRELGQTDLVTELITELVFKRVEVRNVCQKMSSGEVFDEGFFCICALYTPPDGTD
jgi:hypothetical protein